MSFEGIAEIFDTPVSKILGRTIDSNLECTVELTLNYPRTSRFKRLCYASKVKTYFDLLYYMKLQLRFIKSSEEHVEMCYSGIPHMHAILHCSFDKPYSIEGLISEIVDTWISQMPQRTRESQQKFHYCPSFKCYRCPSILAQWTAPDDIERTKKWEDYIRKDIL